MEGSYLGYAWDVLSFADLRGYRPAGTGANLVRYSAVGWAITAVILVIRYFWLKQWSRRQLVVQILAPALIPVLALAYHVVLLGYHRFYHPVGIGGWTVTLLALLGTAAVLLPATALTGLVQSAAERIPGDRPPLTRIVAWMAVTLLLSIVPGVYAAVAAARAFVTLIGAPWWYLIPPWLPLLLILVPLVLRGERAGSRW